MNLSIIIASHGKEHWRDLALRRAVPSAEAVLDRHEVLHLHSPHNTRAEVRNQLAREATGDWLCFLDADDELHPHFCRRMQQAEQENHLLTPAVQYVRNGVAQRPRFWPEQDLRNGNWMVVGTVIEASVFHRLGGWKTLQGTGKLNEWDDWHLWSRAVQSGSVPRKVPKAIYIAHMEKTSAHRSVSHRQRQAWHDEVYRDVWA